ncbi:MAG TPA: SigB/SigF/SigG family RNA polymerase sigma factor [Trebonia sp.]
MDEAIIDAPADAELLSETVTSVAPGTSGASWTFPGGAPQELSDGDLLARCQVHPRGSPQRAAACEVLVRRYTPLVRACVQQFRNSPESAEDLMQVGYLGLLKAIGNYNPAFGNGLRAYATPCITGEIKRHFRDKRWQVRVTRPLQELLLEMRGATEDLTHELGRLPGESELAGRLGVTPEELREARRAGDGFSALSLDAPAGSDDDSAALGDLLGLDDPAVEQAMNMEAVAQHWAELPRREQRILILRFYGNHTQEEVAARLGLSQMHVSRLQARALARLRGRLLGSDGPLPRQDKTA